MWNSDDFVNSNGVVNLNDAEFLNKSANLSVSANANVTTNASVNDVRCGRVKCENSLKSTNGRGNETKVYFHWEI